MPYRDDSDGLRARVRELEAEHVAACTSALRARTAGISVALLCGLVTAVVSVASSMQSRGVRWAHRLGSKLNDVHLPIEVCSPAASEPADETGFVPDVTTLPLVTYDQIVTFGACIGDVERHLVAARAHDITTGAVHWTACAVAHATKSIHSAASGESVLVATGQELVALRAANGRLLWRQARPETTFECLSIVGSFVIGGVHLDAEAGGPMTGNYNCAGEEASDWEWLPPTARNARSRAIGATIQEPTPAIRGVHIRAAGSARASLRTIVLGSRTEGARAGVVALFDYEGHTPKWIVDLPHDDDTPMNRDELSAPDPTPYFAASTDDAVYVLHPGPWSSHLARISLDTGEVAWDTPAQWGATSWNMDRVTTERGFVIAMAGNGVIAFAPGDGRILYKLP